jgi:hypothetical protein
MIQDSSSKDDEFDTPKELNSRNPPFDIEIDFDRYRPGKEYQGIFSREHVVLARVLYSVSLKFTQI